ncbi:MAG: GNAT family N-acetyltransferase [Methylophilales bacterium]|nr:GNAT family N-acetyltransferase [Methylophilales bacterium]
MSLSSTAFNLFNFKKQDQGISSEKNKKKDSVIEVTWARTEKEIKEAQKLRFKIFSEEMGANLVSANKKNDVDIFDDYCEHLIVRNKTNDKVIGTYRVLTPQRAKDIGYYYSELEFELEKILTLRKNMVEVGRACIHKDHRSGGVIMLLWAELGKFMEANHYETLIGCSSVSIKDGGHSAASLYYSLNKTDKISHEYEPIPKNPLPIHQLNFTLEVEPPSLLKGYLRIGAKVCGKPAWDPDFNTADFLTLLKLQDIHPRYAKHFLSR